MVSLLWYLQARLFPKYGMVGMSTGIVALASYHLAHNRYRYLYLLFCTPTNQCPGFKKVQDPRICHPDSCIRNPAPIRIMPLIVLLVIYNKKIYELCVGNI
jgi:hypothetical protein